MPQNPNTPRLDLPQLSPKLETIEIYFSFYKHKNQKTATAFPLPLSCRTSGKRRLLAESNERLQLEVDDRQPGEDPSGNGHGASRESGRGGVMSTAEDPTAEDPTAEDPTAEDPTMEDPTAEDPTMEDLTAEDPTMFAEAVSVQVSRSATEIAGIMPVGVDMLVKELEMWVPTSRQVVGSLGMAIPRYLARSMR